MYNNLTDHPSLTELAVAAFGFGTAALNLIDRWYRKRKQRKRRRPPKRSSPEVKPDERSPTDAEFPPGTSGT